MSGQDSQFVNYCLLMHTGFGNFPNIFFGQEHIGGYDDLKAYMSDANTTDKIMGQNGIVLSNTSDEDVSSINSDIPTNMIFETISH